MHPESLGGGGHSDHHAFLVVSIEGAYILTDQQVIGTTSAVPTWTNTCSHTDHSRLAEG